MYTGIVHIALLSEEKRLASIVAVNKCVCLCLSKEAFRAALSAEKFSEVVTEVMRQRTETRLKREKEKQKMTTSSKRSSISSSLTEIRSDDEFPEFDGVWGEGPDGSNMVIGKSPLRSVKSLTTSGGEISFTSKLLIKKTPEGDKYINKYKKDSKMIRMSIADKAKKKD